MKSIRRRVSWSHQRPWGRVFGLHCGHIVTVPGAGIGSVLAVDMRCDDCERNAAALPTQDLAILRAPARAPATARDRKWPPRKGSHVTLKRGGRHTVEEVDRDADMIKAAGRWHEQGDLVWP